MLLSTSAIFLMAFLARASGGGWPAPLLKEKLHFDAAPEALFGACFGLAVYYVFGSAIFSVAALLWSFAWMETGHGTVLQWGRDPAQAQGARRQMLTPLVERISDRFGFTRGDVNYCRLFMAVKGFFIGLPIGGVLLAVLWPLSYEIGNRVGRNEVCEILSGVSAAVSIIMFLMLIK